MDAQCCLKLPSLRILKSNMDTQHRFNPKFAGSVSSSYRISDCNHPNTDSQEESSNISQSVELEKSTMKLSSVQHT